MTHITQPFRRGSTEPAMRDVTDRRHPAAGILWLTVSALLLFGCGESEPDSNVTETGFLSHVTEFTLSDGTRCAISNDGSLSCDWGER